MNQLMNEGKIWYLDPFTEYLPSDIDTTNWCSSGGRISDVTISDLLTHESGFEDFWDNQHFEPDWENDDESSFWSPRRVLSYMPLLSNSCGNKIFSYADTNFLILGIIIE